MALPLRQNRLPTIPSEQKLSLAHDAQTLEAGADGGQAILGHLASIGRGFVGVLHVACIFGFSVDS